MSGKKTIAKAKPKMDRRARRTRDALGDALIELMQERPFNSITVQDVLARAEVGAQRFIRIIAIKMTCFSAMSKSFGNLRPP